MPSQNRGTTRIRESSPPTVTNNSPIEQALGAPQGRGEPLESNVSCVSESISRAPQLVPDSITDRNDFYNHGQPSVEAHGSGISTEPPEKSEEYGKRLMNDSYEKGLTYFLGKSVVQDYPKAKEYFFIAASLGHAGAQYHLGCIYEKGQNYIKAVEWYQKASSQGNSDAQNVLGDMYYFGREVIQDYSKAIELYQEGANQGNADAQNNLGSMYREGYGVVQDNSKAIENH
ncbi:hypothetical protein BGX26_012506 [Mortierella sp. AD094]|nr:hypothetical protein BGX26_012506 [Mortierella sp. AD094]